MTNAEPEPAGSRWTREQIEQALRSEPFNYQAIKLPHGLSTGGHDRSSTADVIFPNDMTGKSVLDVGSALGFFCFEARHRGANRVVGIDLDDQNVRKAKILADILGEKVEFASRDVERAPLEEAFDYVLCLNVLHHLSNPIQGLDNLIAATKHALILEIATIGKHDRRKLGINWLQQKLFEIAPLLVVGSGTADFGVKQFYITRKAIENLLRYRRGCFASIEFLASPFKERFLVIARKRQIDRLLVVAGPTFPGDDKLLASLKAGASGASGVDLASFSKAPMYSADQYHEPQPPHQEDVVFSYDFMRPVSNGAGTYDHDPSLEVIDGAKEATVLTMWVPPSQLLDATKRQKNFMTGRARKRLSLISAAYTDAASVIERYEAWFKYVATKKCAQRVWVPGESGGAFLTLDDWRRDVAQPALSR